MKRIEIVEAARSYLGVRWVHEGRSRAGMDCIGLVCRVGTDLGVEYEDMKGYDRVPNGQVFVNHVKKYLTPNRSGLILPGSVGLIRQSRYPCHAGIFSEKDGETYFIHAFLPRHKVVEERFIQAPDFGLVAVLDYPNVED